tara:strand:+ start:596 stop:754 length:159 start_codon:yes stop_codon:yes gene_type:complete
MSRIEAKKFSEAKMERAEKRWTWNPKRARIASKSFHKASRAASKRALKNFVA